MVTVLLLLLATLNTHQSSSQYVSGYLPSQLRLPDSSNFGFPSGGASDVTVGQTTELEDPTKELEAARAKADKDTDAGNISNPDEKAPGDSGKALEQAANAEAAVKDMTKKDIEEYLAPSFANKGKKPKAAFVTLIRNRELNDILEPMNMVEKRFNKNYHYPWVFLNNEPFTEEFKETVKKHASGEVIFDLIPKEHWGYPDYVDQDKAAIERKKMADKNIIYGDSESYRHMCRFQSGFFWREKALEDFDWYWRVEPSTKIYCDIPYDPFQYMQDNKKAYGFTITIHEYRSTIESLWKTVKNFIKDFPQYLAKDNLEKFVSEDNLEEYNLCHFWSNFEIANLNVWRSPAYRDFFDYLDKTGNFFYERWGDAPVHSIFVSLFLPKSYLHYFNDFGYYHPPYNHCPIDNEIFRDRNCDCTQKDDFTFKGYSCGIQYHNAQGIKKPSNWEDYSD